MLRKYRKQLIVITSVVVFFSLLGIILGGALGSSKSYRKLTIITEVLALIKRNYVEEVDFTRLFSSAFYGMTEGLDPESFYLSPEEYRQYQKDLVMPRPSSGLEVGRRGANYFLEVLRVLPGSSAAEAGILPGDVLVDIGGRSTRKITIFQARDLLSGDKGSEVRLTIRRKGDKEGKVFTLTRAFPSEERGETKVIEGKVGYIRVPTFTREVVADLEKGLSQFARDKMNYLIIDLRDASGGSLSDMVQAADLLLEKGVILSLRSREQLIASYRAEKGMLFHGKVGVLVNSRTKGLPEAFASALAENNRAEVIGEKSFGSGAVRKAIPLSDGSAIFLAVAKFLSPKGNPLPGRGVSPSFPITVPGALEEGVSPYQFQLMKAVEHLIGAE
jgi:carboxyl-terminal processing protease